MDWLFDPTAWAGLVTLVVLELVLGIDNLVFIAILVDKLPAKSRDRARKLGLLLALGMRIVLLATVSWLASLTQPWLSLFGREFSARDCILIGGGLFLIYKATTEVHGRIEGHSRKPGAYKAQFWMVIIQIVVLDAVFSLDAVVMAVGMTDYLAVMVSAVTIAIFIMMSVSKPLTAFVNRHQTVVMLCLGFLLMVGLSLVLDGAGFHIPKGYLYAAIAFSIMIETINQFAQARMKKRVKSTDMRDRTADAILKLMGAKQLEGGAEEAREANIVLQEAAQTNIISNSEKQMLRGVLNLAQRPVSTIMTPRRDIFWVDLSQPPAALLKEVQEAERSRLLAVEGDLDNVVGVLRKDEFLAKWMAGADRQVIDGLIEEPLYVREDTTVMALLEFLKKYPAGIAIVTDEATAVSGVVTHIDLLEAIAGEFPSQDQPYEPLSIHESPNGEILIDGMASIYDVANKLGVDFKADGHYSTVAGYVLHALGRMPQKGDTLEWQGWKLEIRQMDGRRISRIRAKAIPKDTEA